jgi:hypothetical protein
MKNPILQDAVRPFGITSRYLEEPLEAAWSHINPVIW